MVGDLERKGRRRDELRDPELAAGDQRDLAVDLLELEPTVRHVVGAVLLERTHLEIVDPERARAADLEAVQDREAPAVALDVEERVGHGERQLVPNLGIPDRVADDDQVRHEADPTRTSVHRLPGWKKRSSERTS